MAWVNILIAFIIDFFLVINVISRKNIVPFRIVFYQVFCYEQYIGPFKKYAWGRNRWIT